MEKHKVFISYHHENDEFYKNELIRLSELHDIFIDRSVDTGDIDETLPDETIRTKIRDEYLRDSTVTILLAGAETKNRKHIDWELYSSMIDGTKNKKSGIIAIVLPTVFIELPTVYTYQDGNFAPHGPLEKQLVHPEIQNWGTPTLSEIKTRYSYLPDRIIINMYSGAKISVVPWSKIQSNPERLRALIQFAFNDRSECHYDFSTPMKLGEIHSLCKFIKLLYLEIYLNIE